METVAGRVDPLRHADDADLEEIDEPPEKRHGDYRFAGEPAQAVKVQDLEFAILSGANQRIQVVSASLRAGDGFIGVLEFR